MAPLSSPSLAALSPLLCFSSPCCSPPHRTAPPPPMSSTMAAATPSLPLRVPELRHDPVEQHTRRTRPDEAPVDRSVVVFTSGARRSTPSIRLVQSVPKPAELVYVTAVSSLSFPPRYICRLRPPAFVTAMAELPLPSAMSPSSLQPLQLEPESITVLSMSAGARSTPPLAPPCTTMLISSLIEPRPPQTSSPALIPATPAPTSVFS